MFAKIHYVPVVCLLIMTVRLSFTDERTTKYYQSADDCVQGSRLATIKINFSGECTLACSRRTDCGAYQLDICGSICNLLCINGQCDSSIQLENICTTHQGLTYQKILCTVQAVNYSTNYASVSESLVDFDTTIIYECNNGYAFPDNSRNKTTRCRGPNQWTETLPHCQACPLDDALIRPSDGGGSGAGLTVSSVWHSTHSQYPNSMLNHQNGGGVTGAWSSRSLDANQWIQFDIGRQVLIKAVATQGRNGYAQWVTAYNLQYGDEGSTWTPYNSGEIIPGNTDSDTVVTHNLLPFYARYVRLNVVSWRSHISLRWELYRSGCF